MESKRQLEEFSVGSLPTIFYIPEYISESEQSQLLRHIYEVPISKWKALKNRRLQNWGGVVHEKGLIPQDLPPWLTSLTQRIVEQTGLFSSPINHVLINEYEPDQGIMPHQDGPAYFPVVAILSLGSSVVMKFTPHPRLSGDSERVVNATEGFTSQGEAMENDTDKHLEGVQRGKDRDQPVSILLMPCSLLLFKDMAYSDYLHGIEDSRTHSLDKVVNIFEAYNHQDLNFTSIPWQKNETEDIKECRSICRTANRVSLTCRFVSKVHRNIFKF